MASDTRSRTCASYENHQEGTNSTRDKNSRNSDEYDSVTRDSDAYDELLRMKAIDEMTGQTTINSVSGEVVEFHLRCEESRMGIWTDTDISYDTLEEFIDGFGRRASSDKSRIKDYWLTIRTLVSVSLPDSKTVHGSLTEQCGTSTVGYTPWLTESAWRERGMSFSKTKTGFELSHDDVSVSLESVSDCHDTEYHYHLRELTRDGFTRSPAVITDVLKGDDDYALSVQHRGDSLTLKFPNADSTNSDFWDVVDAFGGGDPLCLKNADVALGNMFVIDDWRIDPLCNQQGWTLYNPSKLPETLH